MSGAVSVDLQQALYNALVTDASLTALLATHAFAGSPTISAVYDRAPQPEDAADATAFPYVVIGDDTIAQHDTDTIEGQETTITLHIWSRYRGKLQMKQIMDAIYNALHDATLSLSGQSFVLCLFEFAESFEDPDGLTLHGVVRYRIITMES